jgi:hypothetical protein
MSDDVSRRGCSLETPCKLPIMHGDFSMQCAIGLPACRQPMRAAPGRPSFPFYERRRFSRRGCSLVRSTGNFPDEVSRLAVAVAVRTRAMTYLSTFARGVKPPRLEFGASCFCRPDAIPVPKYDIRRPQADGGSFEERYWRPQRAFLTTARIACNILKTAVDGCKSANGF